VLKGKGGTSTIGRGVILGFLLTILCIFSFATAREDGREEMKVEGKMGNETKGRTGRFGQWKKVKRLSQLDWNQDWNARLEWEKGPRYVAHEGP
jgi:hypothetical protein